VIWIAFVPRFSSSKQTPPTEGDGSSRDANRATSRQGNQDGEREQRTSAPDNEANVAEPPQAPSPTEGSPSEASMDVRPDPPVPDLWSEPTDSSPRPGVVTSTTPEPVRSAATMIPDIVDNEANVAEPPQTPSPTEGSPSEASMDVPAEAVQGSATLVPGVVQSTATMVPNDHEGLPDGVSHCGGTSPIQVVVPSPFGDITLSVDVNAIVETTRDATEAAMLMKTSEVAFSRYGIDPKYAREWSLQHQKSKHEVRAIIVVCYNNTSVLVGIN